MIISGTYQPDPSLRQKISSSRPIVVVGGFDDDSKLPVAQSSSDDYLWRRRLAWPLFSPWFPCFLSCWCIATQLVANQPTHLSLFPKKFCFLKQNRRRNAVASTSLNNRLRSMYSFSNNAPKKCKETPINGKDLKMTKGRSEFEKAQEQLCTYSYYLAKQQCGMLDLPTLRRIHTYWQVQCNII